MAAATAAIVSGVGVAVSAGTAGMSFAQAAKQGKLKKQAEADAQKAMDEARNKLSVNYYDNLSINKEPYELERDAMAAAGAQAIEAGAESERGVSSVAGRVQMAQQEGQDKIRAEMSKEMNNLDMLSAQEDSRLRDVGVQIDLEEVAGAQQAAADAQKASAAAISSGIAAVGQVGATMVSKAELYGNKGGASTVTPPATDGVAAGGGGTSNKGAVIPPVEHLDPVSPLELQEGGVYLGTESIFSPNSLKVLPIKNKKTTKKK